MMDHLKNQSKEVLAAVIVALITAKGSSRIYRDNMELFYATIRMPSLDQVLMDLLGNTNEISNKDHQNTSVSTSIQTEPLDFPEELDEYHQISNLLNDVDDDPDYLNDIDDVLYLTDEDDNNSSSTDEQLTSFNGSFYALSVPREDQELLLEAPSSDWEDWFDEDISVHHMESTKIPIYPETPESSDNSLPSTPVKLRINSKRSRSSRPMAIHEKFKTEEFLKTPKLLRLAPESSVITRLKKYMSSTRIGQNMRNKRHCMYFSENPFKSTGFSYLDDCPHISTLNSLPSNTTTDHNIPTKPTSTSLKMINDIIVTPTIPQLQSQILRRKII